ncbi:MAG: murein biosynthesis integral membrane protein MurJ [Peptococcaceae bacterium]|nr:murein biosynthesis integral membrane protein MurJ [Peptococcaceae bacterium]
MTKTVAGAALVLMMMNTLARLLGFVRETAVAAIYGAGAYTDAYQVAYTIPYFLQMVLGVALVSSVVPVMVQRIDGGKAEEGWQTASVIMNYTVLLMVLFTAIGVLGADLLVKLTAPGLSQETGKLAAEMTAIMFPSVLFMSVAMLITGILNACRRFAAAAFAPALSSLVIVLGVLLFGRRYESALPVASLVSFVCMLLAQLPALWRTGFRYTFSWDYKNPLVKSVFVNLGAVFLGTATYQIYLAINRFFASSLETGSISALNYAGKLMNLPLGIFVAAVSTSIFPLLSAQALDKDKKDLWDTANRGLKLVLLITLPAAAGLMALSQPIVRLLFERGAFTAADTVMTAGALLWFGPGMGAMAATQVLTRAYYAMEDTKTPLYFGLSSIAVDIVASMLLARAMGPGGLALANSLAAIFYAVGMYVALLRRLPDAAYRGLLESLTKSLAGAAAAAAGAILAYRLAGPILLPAGSIGLLLSVGGAVCAGVLSYIVVIFLLKENEFYQFCNQMRKRIQGKTQKSLIK